MDELLSRVMSILIGRDETLHGLTEVGARRKYTWIHHLSRFLVKRARVQSVGLRR